MLSDAPFCWLKAEGDDSKQKGPFSVVKTNMARLAQGYEIFRRMIVFLQIPMMNHQTFISGMASYAVIAIALPDPFAQSAIPADCVGLYGSATLPMWISFAGILAAIALSQSISRSALEQFGSLVLTFAVARAVSISVVANELRTAIQAWLWSQRSSAMFEHCVREELSGACARTGELNLADGFVRRSATLANSLYRALFGNLPARRARPYSGIRHVTPFQSHRLGLRISRQDVAARSYFPISLREVQA